MSIKNQLVSGVLWNALERFSSQGIQFVLTILMARVLSPDDYGLVAMLGIFMALAQTFVDSGFGSALIQKKEKNKADFNTVFYFNIGVACFIYLLFFLLAPWVADFYQQPRLTEILRVYGVVVILNSLATVQVANYTILLNFKKMAIASFISIVVSGCVAMWMAYYGFGVWALVGQALLAALLWSVCLWYRGSWFPEWSFSIRSFRMLFSFGSKLLGANLLNTLYVHLYSLVVGKFFQTSVLGYFNRSYTLALFPSQNFANVVQKVLYPILCRNQGDDAKLRQLYFMYVRLSAFIVFPVMVGLAVLAEPVISLLLTDKWLPAAPMFRIVCLGLMWIPIMQASVQVLDAKGRSDYHLKSEVIKKVLALLILFASIHWGIYGVCWGILVYSLVDIAVVVFFLRQLIAVGYRLQFRMILPSLVGALLSGGIAWVLSGWMDTDMLKVLLGVLAAMLCYGLYASLFCREELRLVRSLIPTIGHKY